MRIAVTADLHLTTRDHHPERYETLENMLADLHARDIDTLIIAGDLFDAHNRNYADFERICRDEKNRDLSLYVIPGNHDLGIDGSKIVSENLRIFSEPTLFDLDGRSFLFLPYEAGKTMGEVLAQFADQLLPNKWVLVAHGDWAGGLRHTNPAEPGVYMPLTRRDIEVFKPACVLLGHIHAPMDRAPVHYVGSPCGLDITETGRRRYLQYETSANELEPCLVTTPVIYYDESFVIIPADDEAAYLRVQIEKRLSEWALLPEEQEQTQLRVRVRGYSANRASLQAELQEAFDGFSFYKQQPPNIDDVSSSDDVERDFIAEQIRANLEDGSLPNGPDDPGKDDILMAALHIIFGG